MLTMAARYANSFDFSRMTDVQLRETFELWAPENTTNDTPEWRWMYETGRLAIIEETHRRALGMKVREVTVSSFGVNANGVRVVNAYTNTERLVGTAREFMELFGLKVGDLPARREGVLTNRATGPDGELVSIAWEVV